jgi:hypothetical protein
MIFNQLKQLVENQPDDTDLSYHTANKNDRLFAVDQMFHFTWNLKTKS